MRLQEYEAKELLEEHGMKMPSRELEEGGEYVVKAQILQNNRMEMGAVRFAKDVQEAEAIKQEMIGAEFKGIEPEKVIIEEKIDAETEYYVSFMYDTETRKPTLIFSQEGGSGVEDRKVEKLPLEDDSLNQFVDFMNDKEAEDVDILAPVLQDLFQVFLQEDMRLLEVNPLAKKAEEFFVLDAMIDLEDDAAFRHEWDYPDRTATGEEKTERELRAEKIDEDNHQGVAGKYTELDGDIAMMLAGGGASLTNMDALIEYGGEPANYTEYGGNPPTEKVYRLSKVIIDKPRLKGLWHVGGTANNTDIYRTMKGFCQALREEEPDYPIVVRRDGPNADRAFELLREVRDELDLNMKLYRNDTPMTETAELLMEMIKEDKDER